MRILHVVHQYLPEYVGGTEYYTWGLAHQQVKIGHSVAVVYPSAVSKTLEPDNDQGIRVYRVPVGERSRTAVFLSTFRQSQLTEAFSAVLQREQPDLVHIQHMMGWPITIVDLIVAAGIPYLVTLHDYWHVCSNAQLLTNYDETNCTGPHWWLNCAHCALARANHPRALPLIPALAPLLAYRHTLTRRILAKAAVVIAPTNFVHQMHISLKLPSGKVQVVPHGIEVPAELPPRVLPRQELHLAYIGSIARQKGVHVLIEAMNQLPIEGIKLSVYGDTTVFPDYTAQLQNLIQHPGITLNGRIPRPQLWQLLAEVDALVMPTLWYEASPLIIQEAHAAGVPVIASRIGGLPEKINDGIDGILVTPGDVAALRGVLHHFWQNRAALEQLRAGIQPVQTTQEHIRHMETVYTSVVPPKTTPLQAQ